MSGNVFIDSNIFIYIYSKTDPTKSELCKNYVIENDCYTSTQALNELSNVCIKKWNIDRQAIENAIDEIFSACKVCSIYEETIKKALCLHEKYRYSYYDSLMLASAIENGCEKIFTEDMQNGQLIENTLMIVNIFKRDTMKKQAHI